MNPDIVLLVTDASDLVGRYCASRSVSEVEVLPGLILSSGMIVTSGRILASGAGVSSCMFAGDAPGDEFELFVRMLRGR
jgi:hypothetical protein